MSAAERRYLQVLATAGDDGPAGGPLGPPERLDQAVADLVQRLDPFPTMVKGAAGTCSPPMPPPASCSPTGRRGRRATQPGALDVHHRPAREVYLDWELEARAMLGRFRLAAARYRDDPDFRP